jgi:hypothetical protein
MKSMKFIFKMKILNFRLKLKILSIQKGLGEPCSNRNVWKNQKISNYTSIKALYYNNHRLPIWNDSIYFEWRNSRIRVNSDNMIWDRVRPLKELVEAECIEYKNRYLKKIEEYLIEISKQPSWVSSNHSICKILGLIHKYF